MSHRVLVVDDDEEIREALCELLTGIGYTAVALANGQEALDELHSGALPCMVFLDLMMPVVDGWEVLRQRGQDPTLAAIPFVVITASGSQAVSVSATRVLQKPFPIERVIDAAQEFC